MEAKKRPQYVVAETSLCETQRPRRLMADLRFHMLSSRLHGRIRGDMPLGYRSRSSGMRFPTGLAPWTPYNL